MAIPDVLAQSASPQTTDSTTRSRPGLTAVMTAAGVGVAGDILLKGAEAPGITVALCVALLRLAWALIASLSAGALRAWLWRPAKPLDPGFALPKGAAAAATPVTIGVAALVLMFLLCVAVQLRWLFGGAALVQSLTGLSYAEYARQGF